MTTNDAIFIELRTKVDLLQKRCDEMATEIAALQVHRHTVGIGTRRTDGPSKPVGRYFGE